MSKLLFCFGSNNLTQLRDRIGHDAPATAAFIRGYERAFRGFSRNWGGGTATLIPKKDKTTFGLVVMVSDHDLSILDRYEGVHVGVYKLVKFSKMSIDGVKVHRTFVQDDEGEFVPKQAYAYLATSKEFNPPTKDYLKAVAKTVGTFWTGDSGKVKPSDFPIR